MTEYEKEPKIIAIYKTVHVTLGANLHAGLTCVNSKSFHHLRKLSLKDKIEQESYYFCVQAIVLVEGKRNFPV